MWFGLRYLCPLARLIVEYEGHAVLSTSMHGFGRLVCHDFANQGHKWERLLVLKACASAEEKLLTRPPHAHLVGNRGEGKTVSTHRAVSKENGGTGRVIYAQTQVPFRSERFRRAQNKGCRGT
jgi:hypothetical protein